MVHGGVSGAASQLFDNEDYRDQSLGGKMYNARRFQPRLFGLIAFSLLFAFASFAYASRAELDEIDYAIHSKGAR